MGQSSQQRQSQRSQEYEQHLAELKAKLDAMSKERAGEYLDVQERLYDVLKEYSTYMDELAQDAEFKGKLSLQPMMKRVQDGYYADDPDKLQDDIYHLIDDIKAVENRLRVKYGSNEPKGSRVLRNFRRELIIIADLVEDYTDQKMTSLLKQRAMSDYIKAALESAMDALKQVQNTPKPETPEKPGVPPEPKAPEPPGYIPPKSPEAQARQDVIDQWRRGKSDRSGKIQTYQANITVSSSRPVYIDNTVGDVIITGDDEPSVSAVLGIEVSAQSGEKEAEFVKQTSLKVTSESDGYHVYSVLPRIADVKTEVLRSRLEVTVPAGNLIVCTSSFGVVAVSDLEAGTKIEGNNCNVTLEDVAGAVQVTNSRGPITITDVKGDITAKNSYGQIAIENCDGALELENAYAAIQLSGNRGRLTVDNSGQISVEDHIGDVKVDNRYGAVAISDVEGDVTAHNAYQSLAIQGINGSVHLENAYGTISAEDISGLLSADNNSGTIALETVTGPIDVTSRAGSISLVLDEGFRGRSSITSIGGTIQLKVAEQPDLLVTIHTTGGTITSNLPITVNHEGVSRSAELMLGEGGETLDLSGTNSSIVISGRL